MSAAHMSTAEKEQAGCSKLTKRQEHNSRKGKGKVHPRTGHEGPEGE
jgi:hypothetical protein